MAKYLEPDPRTWHPTPVVLDRLAALRLIADGAGHRLGAKLNTRDVEAVRALKAELRDSGLVRATPGPMPIIDDRHPEGPLTEAGRQLLAAHEALEQGAMAEELS